MFKWKKRDFAHDAPRDPKNPHSTVLSREEEALITAFHKHILLPLDDCLYWPFSFEKAVKPIGWLAISLT